MKLKKILATLLCVAMTIGTMGFSAFAEKMDYVAKIGEQDYATLKDAFAAAEDGDVVMLVDNIEVNEAMTVSDDITLDLNGCTITGTDTKASGNFALITIKKDATVIIDDTTGAGAITLEAETDRGWNALSAVISNEGGNLTIEGGRLEHLGGSSMAYAIDNNSTLGETTVTVNDGTIASTYRAIRAFQNSKTEMNTININGGEISARAGIWMQQPGASASHGTLNVTDGEFDCVANAIVTDLCGAGETEINISGGDFKNQSTTANLLLVWPLDTMAKAENATVIMNIEGGTFDCAGEGKLFGFLDENNATLENASDMVTVSGGEFNQAFDESYLAENFSIVENQDGSFGVANQVEKPSVVGDVDGDSDVDFIDATMALQAYTEAIILTAEQIAAADVNGDGTVDFLDATAILQMWLNS